MVSIWAHNEDGKLWISKPRRLGKATLDDIQRGMDPTYDGEQSLYSFSHYSNGHYITGCKMAAKSPKSFKKLVEV